jgi:WD40 repeat protein
VVTVRQAPARPKRPQKLLLALLGLVGWLVRTLGPPVKTGLAGAVDSSSDQVPFKKWTDLGTLKNCAFVGFSPDGRVLATASEGKWNLVGPIRLWDVGTGKLLAAVAQSWTKVETVRFSPNSTLIAAHQESGEMRVWDVRTGKSRAAFRPPTKFGNWVNFWFSPDSKALIYEHYGEKFPSDSLFHVWDIGSGRRLGSFDGEPWMFAFTPDGKRLATGTTAATHDKRNCVMLWAWDGGKKKPATLIAKHAVRVDEVAFSPDLSTFATANYEAGRGGAAEVMIRDMRTGRKRASLTFLDKETRIQELAFSPDGSMLVVSGGGGTQLDWITRTTVWDITAKPPKRVGTFPVRPIFSTDGRLLAAPTETGVRLHAARTGRQVADLTQPREASFSFFVSYNNHKTYPSARFDRNGRFLVVTGLFSKDRASWWEAKARVWQVNPVKQIRALDEGVEAIFSPDGRTLLVRYSDGNVKLWRVHQ